MLFMARKSCKTQTKTYRKWDNPLNEARYNFTKAVCDLTGKFCKTSEDIKEGHTVKVEEKIEDCR